MIEVEALLISPNAPVLDALHIIDRATTQIALVVDDEKCLLGTLTDGDIRRGFICGETLESPVCRLMNSNFHSVSEIHDQSLVFEMMRKKSLRQIPVLDDQGRVSKLILLKEFLEPLDLPNAVVIMAGGKGTRLRPYTENCPKPMLLVDDKPMLEILLEQCIASGFRNFYFSVNYLKEYIIDYFQNGEKWGVSISYLVENEPLGTAGSLQLLPSHLTEPFLVMNGDVLTKLDTSRLLNFHHEHDALGTMCVREYTATVPFGVVQTNGVDLESFIEKPSYTYFVNAGVYIINPKLLSLISENQKIDMPTLLQNAQEAGHRISVCPIHEYWLDIGRPETLSQAHNEWPNRSLL